MPATNFHVAGGRRLRSLRRSEWRRSAKGSNFSPSQKTLRIDIHR